MTDPGSPPNDRTRLAPASRPPIDDATRIADPAQPAADATVIASDAAPAGPLPEPLASGTLINNNYRISELVSAGGMGEVYRAENLFTGDPVAVKVILPGLADDKAVLDLFRREARVLVQLRDDAIVRYHNFVLDPSLGRYCLIMEFVEGRHLGSRIKADGPLPIDAVLALLRRLAAGLARAHARGVTHRDLSPDNVILRDDHISEAVLIDFGIARSTELGDGLQGRFAGKFKYIAPEQLSHWDGNIGPWTDVYGLALLIAMVAQGKPLDMGDSVISASSARQAIPDLSGLSHRLFPLLQYMLEPDPARRVQDMPAVLRLLDDPMALPAQYRLPLWTPTAAEPAQIADPDTGAGTGTANLPDPSMPDTTASESPFAALANAAPATAPPPSAPRRIAPALWAGGGVLAAIAGAAIWLSQGAPEPGPTIEDPPQIAHMLPRDPATREGFLASQPLPPCTFARRVAQGDNAGMIEVLAAQPVDTSALTAAYAREFGASPATILQQITPDQCPVADFLTEAAGRPASSPALTADPAETDSGFQIQGQVHRNDRNLWLFIASPQGEIYNLTDQVQPDGRFAVGIQAADRDAAYMLVALGTNAPLTSVTAAPPATKATVLLPKVIDELNRSSEFPAVDVLLITMGIAATP